MTRMIAVAALAVAALSPLLGASAADAKGGKEYYAEVYTFSKPMNGYQGFSGAYHCSYVKTPKRVCTASGCKQVWELLQTCQ